MKETKYSHFSFNSIFYKCFTLGTELMNVFPVDHISNFIMKL